MTWRGTCVSTAPDRTLNSSSLLVLVATSRRLLELAPNLTRTAVSSTASRDLRDEADESTPVDEMSSRIA